MTLQTSVNIKQAYAKVGTYADDSPRRATAYQLFNGTTSALPANGSIALAVNPSANDTITIGQTTLKAVSSYVAVAANGSITLAENMSANDTITIGSTTLKAVASDAGAGEFLIGETLAATLATIAALTVSDVTLSANATTLFVVASTAGAAGNLIDLAASASTATVVAMHGGVDAGSPAPVLARFYTLDESGRAVMGGNGVQLGLAMNNGSVALFGGLEASLEVPTYTACDICSFGHVYVKVTEQVAIGNLAAYDTTTGEIHAYAATGDAPAGCTAITGAAFISASSAAGQVAILSLNGK